MPRLEDSIVNVSGSLDLGRKKRSPSPSLSLTLNFGCGEIIFESEYDNYQARDVLRGEDPGKDNPRIDRTEVFLNENLSQIVQSAFEAINRQETKLSGIVDFNIQNDADMSPFNDFGYSHAWTKYSLVFKGMEIPSRDNDSGWKELFKQLDYINQCPWNYSPNHIKRVRRSLKKFRGTDEKSYVKKYGRERQFVREMVFWTLRKICEEVETFCGQQYRSVEVHSDEAESKGKLSFEYLVAKYDSFDTSRLAKIREVRNFNKQIRTICSDVQVVIGNFLGCGYDQFCKYLQNNPIERFAKGSNQEIELTERATYLQMVKDACKTAKLRITTTERDKGYVFSTPDYSAATSYRLRIIKGHSLREKVYLELLTEVPISTSHQAVLCGKPIHISTKEKYTNSSDNHISTSMANQWFGGCIGLRSTETITTGIIRQYLSKNKDIIDNLRREGVREEVLGLVRDRLAKLRRKFPPGDETIDQKSYEYKSITDRDSDY